MANFTPHNVPKDGQQGFQKTTKGATKVPSVNPLTSQKPSTSQKVARETETAPPSRLTRGSGAETLTFTKMVSSGNLLTGTPAPTTRPNFDEECDHGSTAYVECTVCLNEAISEWKKANPDAELPREVLKRREEITAVRPGSSGPRSYTSEETRQSMFDEIAKETGVGRMDLGPKSQQYETQEWINEVAQAVGAPVGDSKVETINNIFEHFGAEVPAGAFNSDDGNSHGSGLTAEGAEALKKAVLGKG